MCHGVGSSVFRRVELKITFCVFPQIFFCPQWRRIDLREDSVTHDPTALTPHFYVQPS